MSLKIQRILILDDDPGVRQALSAYLQREGYQTTTAATISEAREILDTQRFDLIMADLLLGSGVLSLRFVAELRKLRPMLPIIIFTGHGSMDTAIEAIKLGVFDYMLKPINAEELKIALARLESIVQMRAENHYLRQEAAQGKSRVGPIWGNSSRMQEVLRLIDAVAPTDSTILITGESGSGKESLARLIYERSQRSNAPFVRVNCASAPGRNLESELFGEDIGRDNALLEQRVGRIEMANGGTIFLEEIAELPLALQIKLLKLLDDREIERVGSHTSVPVNVRVIASTSRSLREEIARDRFLQELYYRLSMFPITVPPLRERSEDLQTISKGFLEQITRRHGKVLAGFSPSAWSKMQEYSWPGNVRELYNVIERAVILAAPGATIESEDLALHGAPRETAALLLHGNLPNIDEMERRLIGLMLKQTNNNKSKASRKLGISIRTMRNKLLRYKAEGFDPENPDTLLKITGD